MEMTDHHTMVFNVSNLVPTTALRKFQLHFGRRKKTRLKNNMNDRPADLFSKKRSTTIIVKPHDFV